MNQTNAFWPDTDVSGYRLPFQTFALFVHKDRLVLVHDVVEEQSSASPVCLGAEAQISPEGSFEGEVPRCRDAIFSWKFNFLRNRTEKKEMSRPTLQRLFSAVECGLHSH